MNDGLCIFSILVVSSNWAGSLVFCFTRYFLAAIVFTSSLATITPKTATKAAGKNGPEGSSSAFVISLSTILPAVSVSAATRFV